MEIKTCIGESLGAINHATSVRHACFAEEQKLLDPVRFAAPREIDAFDPLPTTKHILAYVDEQAVGTGRMILPNAEVAKAMGTRNGFDIESSYVIDNLVRPGMRIAETMRYCVLPSARHLPVAAALVQEALRFSLQEGITHWLGRSAMGTSNPLEAARIAAAVEEMGFVNRDAWITPRQTMCPNDPGRGVHFESASCGLPMVPPSNTNVPPLLGMYLRRLKARVIGWPMYDSRFRGYSIPMLITVADQKFRKDQPMSPLQPSPIAA